MLYRRKLRPLMFESGGQIVDPQEKLEQTSLQSYYKKIPVYRTGLERTMNIEPMPNQVPNSTKRKRMAYEEGGQIAEPPAESAENKTSKEKEEIKEPEIKEPEIKEPANKKAKKNLTAESKTDPEKEQTEKPDDKQDDKVTGLAAVDQKKLQFYQKYSNQKNGYCTISSKTRYSQSVKCTLVRSIKLYSKQVRI